MAHETSTATRTLTSDVFGKLLILAWAERHGRSVLPSQESLTEALLSAAAPERVKEVLHVDDRTGEPRIQEFTQYIVSAQGDGLLRRMNPSYVMGEVKVDAPIARRILEKFAKHYASEINWLRQRVEAVGAQPS